MSSTISFFRSAPPLSLPAMNLRACLMVCCFVPLILLVGFGFAMANSLEQGYKQVPANTTTPPWLQQGFICAELWYAAYGLLVVVVVLNLIEASRVREEEPPPQAQVQTQGLQQV
jgi:hypothetical protein